MTTKEQVELKAKELQEYINKETREWVTTVTCLKLAKHVLASEIKSEINGLCFCHPDLNSESGITIKMGSVKQFALNRKIELEAQLKELESL